MADNTEEDNKPNSKPSEPSLHGKLRFIAVAASAAIPLLVEVICIVINIVARPTGPSLGMPLLTFLLAGLFGGTVTLLMYIMRNEEAGILDQIAIGSVCLCLWLLYMQWEYIFK